MISFRFHAMYRFLLIAAAAAALIATAAPLAAQDSSSFDFSITNIMRGPEVYGRAPERVTWSPDSKWIYFYWLPPGSDWRDRLAPYRVRAVTGATPERLTPAEMDSAGPLLESGNLSHDTRMRAVSYDGDLYVVDLRTQRAHRLTQTAARESDPQFDVGDTRVFFTRDDNVFSIDLHGGLVRQLTDVRSGPAPTDVQPASAQRIALVADQKRLFAVIRDEYRADSIEKADSARRDSLGAKPLYLRKNERVSQLAVSPNGRALLLVTRTPAEQARATEVPQWVTKSGYVEDLKGRDKVGDVQAGGRIALVSLPSGDARWLHPIPGDTAATPALTQVLGWNDDGSRALLFAV
ncbi:MAG TPA: DPP IV N-terminal domain-containing protein, partial [Gemmatimonadaceae bacterium]